MDEIKKSNTSKKTWLVDLIDTNKKLTDNEVKSLSKDIRMAMNNISEAQTVESGDFLNDNKIDKKIIFPLIDLHKTQKNSPALERKKQR